MRKMKLRILAIILICCLLCTTQFSVAAQESYLGSDDDISGYIVPDDTIQTRGPDDFSQESGDLIGNNPLIFSITAAEVTSILASSAGRKSFTISDLPSTATRIIVKATLSHSLQDVPGIIGNLNECVYAGVCYYGYNAIEQDYAYIPVFTIGPEWGGFGQELEGSFLIEDTLEWDVTYYSFVKNRYPAGYVFGTVSLYYSSI